MIRFSTRLAALLIGITAVAGAHATDSYPSKPIKMIVPYPPSGGTDVLARTLAQKLSEAWKVPVIVENRPGADTAIGTSMVARGEPDGYTLGLVTPTFAINKSLYPKLPFDPTKDFTFISPLVETPNFLVVQKDSPYKNVKDLLERARKESTPLTFSSSSSVIMLTGELMKSAAQLKATHVPYKGSGPSVLAVASGHVDYTFDTLLATRPLIEGGKLRIIGATSKQRSALLPEVPTMAEEGLPQVEVTTWYALIGPSGMTSEVVEKLNGEVKRIMLLPDVRKQTSELGATPFHMSSEKFTTFVDTEFDRFGEVIKANNLTPNR